MNNHLKLHKLDYASSESAVEDSLLELHILAIAMRFYSCAFYCDVSDNCLSSVIFKSNVREWSLMHRPFCIQIRSFQMHIYPSTNCAYACEMHVIAMCVRVLSHGSIMTHSHTPRAADISAAPSDISAHLRILAERHNTYAKVTNGADSTPNRKLCLCRCHILCLLYRTLLRCQEIRRLPTNRFFFRHTQPL
jgi:hypothetical protein